MNWFDNVSSDSDQPIAPARLLEGHWRHQLNPYTDPELCRVVIDAAEPRVVAAQVLRHGLAEDVDSGVLDDLNRALATQGVLEQPTAWGFAPCTMMPSWARPTFSEKQIEELQRIEGYLIEASDENVESVLALREAFLRGIGLTDRDMYRAAREPQPVQVGRKSSRVLIN